MMFLFRMECKKIGKSILYWVLVLVLLIVCLLQYDRIVESELRRTNDHCSVFFTAPGGSYAGDLDDGSDEDMERAMMIGATNRLIENYRSNRYDYYPFGYIKEKTMSAQGQAIILQYLIELTGLSEQVLNGTVNAGDDAYVGDVPISGGGAFVLEPGKGGTNENGQFVIHPEDWQYVENSGTSAQTSNRMENVYAPTVGSFEIQVSFDRFKEIMEEVSRLIGRNSYFSWTMLTLYYVKNDMQDNPITEQQHLEFYESDHVTGAFARYYCDSISLAVLFLPAFVIVDLMLRDKRHKMQGLTYQRTISSAKAICTRYVAAICMTMLPILVLPVKSLFVLMQYCGSIGVQADALAFVKYTFAWIFPTVLLVMAISLFVTALLENYTAILLTGLIWLAGRPSVDKIAGGNYGLFDLIIRHNTLKGYGRMMENIQMLILNRVIISVIALALVGLSVAVYDIKRKGGLILWGKKSSHNHKRKYSSDF